MLVGYRIKTTAHFAVTNRDPRGRNGGPHQAGYALRKEGKMGKVTVINQVKFGPTQFQEEIERLQRDGKMPSLEAVLSAVAEIREIYRPRILAARKDRRVK